LEPVLLFFDSEEIDRLALPVGVLDGFN